MSRLLVACTWLVLYSLSTSTFAATPLAAPQPNLENLQLLRDQQIPPLAVGEFVRGAMLPQKADKAVSVRGHRIEPSVGGSFASQVRETLVTDLRTAGVYDPTATVTVSGELLENELHAAGTSRARASLVARFLVTKDGLIVYDKNIREAAEWKSSFTGAVAIPEAFNQYSDRFPKLLAQFYRDPDLAEALGVKRRMEPSISAGTKYDDLLKLDDLRKRGAISEEEFQAEKTKLLEARPL